MRAEDKKWCNMLLKSCNLKTDNDFDLYLKSINYLKKSDDPEVLRHMLHCFRDIDAGEIQYELVEACEAFPDEIYVSTFIEEAKTFENESPQWFNLMFQSILNSSNCKQLAISIIKKCNELERTFFLKYIKKLSEHTPKYLGILREL